MIDLWLSVAVVMAIAAILFAFTCALGPRCSGRAVIAIALSMVAFLVAYLLWGRDAPRLAELLPFKSVIIYSNPVLPLTGVIAGLIYNGRFKIPRWRRMLLAMAAFLFAGYTTLTPLLNRPPNCIDRWSGGVCLQTSAVTCTPAAAATLLRHHSIDTTEEDMARLCLTGPQGTPILGLYRGLRIMTKHARRPIRAGVGDLNDLKDPANLPSIINVQLTARVNLQNPRYSQQWGWHVGVTHTVVVYGFTTDGRVDIGDPGVGREYWDLYSLRDLWHGVYMAIAHD